jgi:hypothetical protein
MANLVYCDDNQLLKNNYYFALSTTPACNPTQLSSQLALPTLALVDSILRLVHLFPISTRKLPP